MLLIKNRESYPKKCFWRKKKESRVKRWSAFEQLRPVIAASKTKVKMFYLRARRTLATVPSDYKHLTPNHTISFQNLLIMIHSLITFKICHNHIYLSQEPSSLPAQLIYPPVRQTNIESSKHRTHSGRVLYLCIIYIIIQATSSPHIICEYTSEQSAP